MVRKNIELFFFSELITLLVVKDIDKNGKVDSKEMEQIVTVCIHDLSFLF